jgi:protein SCO1/2
VKASALWLALVVMGLSSEPVQAGEFPRTRPRDVGVEEHVGARLPLAARFRSSDGRSVTLGDFIGTGRPTLLMLAYTRCPMLCSVVVPAVASSVRRSRLVAGRDFGLVALSIDPRDTPDEAARAQATALEQAGFAGQKQRWPFLVGQAPEIASVAERLGVHYAWDDRTQQYAHPAVIFALSSRGEVSGYLYGLRFEPEELEAALSGAGSASGRALDTSVLACFRGDFLARRYGRRIERLFQLGSLSVLMALLAGIVVAARKGRALR